MKKIYPRLAVLLMAIVLLVSPSTYGLTPEERRNYTYRGITFIDGACSGSYATEAVDITQAQANNAKIVIGIAKTMGLNREGALVGLITALQESGLKNYANNGSYVDNDENYSSTDLAIVSEGLPHDAVGNDHDSVGIFQQRVSGGWAGLGSGYDNLYNPKATDVIGRLMDPAFAAAAFFKALIAISAWQAMNPGVAAQTVQVSAFPDAYQTHVAEANGLLDQYWDTAPAIPLPAGITADGSAETDSGLGSCGTTGRDAILQKIMEYAWPTYNDPRSAGSDGISGCLGNCVSKQAYKDAMSKASYTGGCNGVDCGAFVTAVMRDSGADPQYNTNPECNTRCQLDYLRRNSDPGGKYTRVKSADELQPGDIAIRDNNMYSDFEGGYLPGHTFFYVGDALKDKIVDGAPWKGVTASASQCGRAPMASGMDNFEQYEWYHLN